MHCAAEQLPTCKQPSPIGFCQLQPKRSDRIESEERPDPARSRATAAAPIGACSELKTAPTKACTVTASPDKSVNQDQLPRQKRVRHLLPRQEREQDAADPTGPCYSGRAPIEAGVNWLWGTEPR